ncbi:MAG: hypothetical protein RR697_03600 [Malacoplasma sp.]
MKNKLNREILKELGYELTNLRKQYIIDDYTGDYDFCWIMTNGNNFIYENGEIISKNDIESFNKETKEHIKNGNIKKYNWCMPCIDESKEIEIIEEELEKIKDILENGVTCNKLYINNNGEIINIIRKWRDGTGLSKNNKKYLISYLKEYEQ